MHIVAWYARNRRVARTGFLGLTLSLPLLLGRLRVGVYPGVRGVIGVRLDRESQSQGVELGTNNPYRKKIFNFLEFLRKKLRLQKFWNPPLQNFSLHPWNLQTHGQAWQKIIQKNMRNPEQFRLVTPINLNKLYIMLHNDTKKKTIHRTTNSHPKSLHALNRFHNITNTKATERWRWEEKLLNNKALLFADFHKFSLRKDCKTFPYLIARIWIFFVSSSSSSRQWGRKKNLISHGFRFFFFSYPQKFSRFNYSFIHHLKFMTHSFSYCIRTHFIPHIHAEPRVACICGN